MNNLRQSQSAPVVDHFKQKQSTKLSTGSVDRKINIRWYRKDEKFFCFL
nr:MAG TPA: hypothetical protein [Caudoviricetes sp.]